MNDEITLSDMTHGDVEGAAAELAGIMTKLYGEPYRRGDVLDQASAFVTGRSAAELALGLASLSAEVRSDADELGLTFDDLLAEANDGDALALTAEASAAEVARLTDSGSARQSGPVPADRGLAAVEAERIVRTARERGTLNRGGKRKSGPDLVHDFSSDDPTDSRQPARGGDDWRAEVERITRQHATEMGRPLDSLESPRGASSTIRRKSPGEQALGRRRSAGRDRAPLTMASPVPQGSTATEVPVTSAYSGTLTT